MKICFISAASNIHTVRWVNSMAARGHQVVLITMHDVKQDKINPEILIYKLNIPAPFGYYMNAPKVKRLLKMIQPDLVHAHYASGYGTLARLSAFIPTLLTVWGSDVYLFPDQSRRNEKLVRNNLAFANRITSSSHAMRKRTEQFISPPQQIDVIPFGIDLNCFKPERQQESDMIVIGTVKRLEPIYGIDILLRAVAILIDKLSVADKADIAAKVRLQIVGEGAVLDQLKRLMDKLGIADITIFTGAVPNEQVPSYLNGFDIYAALSRSESFGVAVLEASACGVPVIVSNVGGLPEVVKDGETGLIVENENPQDAADKLFQLVIDEKVRRKMGRCGHMYTKCYYDWDKNVSDMERVYEEMINCQIKVEEQ